VAKDAKTTNERKEENVEYLKSGLQRNIVTLEQNIKTAKEYQNNVIRLFIQHQKPGP
jgi:hypothetical protein